ncbi:MULTISPECIES: MucBP domain-containing protein [unclassified Staphylococcus]|uniref:MucBP domain-containing protein n=1 Tax=unclassified Staphylococcus TaxID=91994 RepID=UPI0021CED8F1|nr:MULTISPECIES: MucBP domain-containing protein [unclassified Staphylococcus]UXR75573.1 MucBP domain-containing protein [Staphylococcus sp. IVB6233]UXR79774.1 MucBP domain-containing protein [Staphylococcus sp. IVB6218]
MVEGTTEVTYVYKEVKGDVIVHYIDTEGNVIADDAVDTSETSTGTAYDTSDDHKPQTITKDGVTYELVPVLTKGNEQGKVVEGTTEVTYVYKKVEAPSTPEDPGMPPEETPNKYIPYIPEDPENPKYDENVLPVDPNTGEPLEPIDYDDTPEDPSDNPPLPDIDGHIPVDPEDPTTPLKPKDPNDPTKGYEPPKPVDPKEDTPVPYVPAGMVTVHYVDKDGNVIKDPTVDTPKSPVGTEYNTNENGEEIPKEITKNGKVYEYVKVKDGDKEKGKVVKGNTDVTYIYKLKKQPEDPGMPPEETPNKYIPYIPEDPENPKYDENVPPVDPNTGEPLEPIDYDDTPEDPSDNPPLPDIDGHIPVDPEDPTKPLKPKDPNDPTKGYEPPKPVDPKEDTPVPYVPAGMVTVHYVDEDGNVIKDPTVDTPKSPVGTEYNTNENGEEIPKEITKDGKVYEYVKVKDGDKETGKVVKGNTDVTYIYKLKKQPEDPGMPPEETPNKYIPYIPEDPENPKYDENVPPVDPNTGEPLEPIDYDDTPEDPSDNPPLPDIDGHIPVDPEDPTKPLKPKDPNDPTKGYEPPKPVDPKEDTPVPYVPAGMVTVHYVDEDGNVIKDPTVDTPKSPVGTEYNTNENGEEIPKEITKDGKVYEYVKVKDGDKETGKVVKGNTDVTYIYKLKEQPGQPGVPGTPGTPEDPSTPPVDPKDEDPNVPPMDPKDEDPNVPPMDPKDEDPNVPPMDPKDKDPNVPPMDPKDEDSNTPPMDPGMPSQPSPDQSNNMEKPSKGLTDKDGKDMKPSDKMTEKELPETGNTNNPFVTTFGFLTLLAGMKLTKRNRREED